MKTIQFAAFILLLGASGIAQTTWYEIPTGTNKKLNTIHFLTSSVGYIGGNDSLLLKTTDGGLTWNEISYTGITFYPGDEHIISIQFITENTGYVSTGPYGGTYKTTDGGLTWIQIVAAGTICFYEGLYFFDEQNGFIGGSGCFQGEQMDKMTAGVLAPVTMNDPGLSADERIVDIDFLNSNFGLAASAGGRIFRTTNGGLTWDSIYVAEIAQGTPLTSVLIINDTLAYAGYDGMDGSGFGPLITTDAGLTWSMEMSWATFYYPDYLCLHESGAGILYSGAAPSGGGYGLIFELMDLSGPNFYSVDHPINDMYSYEDSIVFGVGDSGYVVVNQPLAELGLNNDTNIKINFAIYPNPADDVIFIGAESKQEEFNYTILNLTGQIILQGETQNKKVNVADLPPGFFVIQISDQVTQGNTKFIKL